MSQTLAAAPYSDPLLFQGVLARRLLAFIIDALLIGVFSWACAFTVFVFGILTLGLGFLMFHIIPFVPFIYYTVLVPAGGTPGQRLFNLSVREDASLAVPNHTQAFVWSLLLWISFALACLPFAMALIGPRHRAGHDLLSGLVVIRAHGNAMIPN